MAETLESAAEHWGILQALSEIGYEYDNLTAFRNSRERYKDAVPLLIDWLNRVEHDINRARLANALAVPVAKGIAVPALVAAFKDAPDEDPHNSRWAIGDALEATYVDAYLPQVLDLVTDRRYGKSREMVVLALGKSKQEAAIDVLIELTDDPDVDGHAVYALSKRPNPRARAVFVDKATDRRAWVRKKAAIGLRKVGE